MAISTQNAFLMYDSSTSGTASYTKVCDVKSFPDLGGRPELLDTTTLTNTNKTGIPGMTDLDILEFDANYTLADYTTVSALAGSSKNYAVWLGIDSSGSPDGHNGKFEFTGELSVYVTGGSVNEVVGMKIEIACSSDIKQTASAS